MTEAARNRQPIDLDEFERRLRAGVPSVRSGDDPLAELARLVGQDDPFRSMSGEAGRLRAPSRRQEPSVETPVVLLHPPRIPEPAVRNFEPESRPSAAPEIGASHVADNEREPAETAAEPMAEDEAYALRGALLDSATNEWSQDDATDVAHPAHDYYLTAEAETQPVMANADSTEEEAPPRRSVRGVILLLAIIGAGAVGFGATSGVKGSLIGLASKMPPVILAGGPTKVQADDPASTGAISQSASILDKAKTEKPVQAKLVSNEEQPVDLSQQPKSASPAAAAEAPPPAAAPASPAPIAVASAAPISPPPPAQAILPDVVLRSVPKPLAAATSAATRSVSPPAEALALLAPSPVNPPPPTPNSNGFPEPKRVKVVSVRPDGSIIGSETAPVTTAAPPTFPTMVSAAPPAATAAPGSANSPDPVAAATADAADIAPVPQDVPVPKPRPSQLSVKPSRSKPTQVADAGAPVVADTTSPEAAPPAPKPARVPARPPAQVADAADADTTATASTGGYAVQLAAAPNEEEARSTLQHLQRKFSDELAGHKGTFHRVKVGDKQVYRVRIGNLSHEEATNLCGKLQANGGACFVAVQN